MLKRAASAFVFAQLAATAHAATEIRALTEVIEGHQVGGVTADRVGDLYVADFGETVWKITVEGERRVFATGLYGASGNAIDAQGNLLRPISTATRSRRSIARAGRRRSRLA